MRRYFEKQTKDGVTWWLVDAPDSSGVRFYVSWGTVGGAGHGMTVTRDSKEDCAEHVRKKIHEKLADGYVETPLPEVMKTLPPKPLQPVLPSYFAHAEKFKFKPYLVSGTRRSHHVFGNSAFQEFVVAAPEDTVGIRFAVKSDHYEEALVHRFLRRIESVDLPSIEVAAKIPLDEPIDALTHALVLAPVVAQLHHEGLTKRQLFAAYPIYDCEFRGDEDVTIADARTNGRDCIPSSRWKREPHPVVDIFMRPASKLKKPPKFLVFPPQHLERCVKKIASDEPGAVMELRNFRNETWRVLPGDPPLLERKPNAPEAMPIEAIVEALSRFVRTGA